MPRSLAIGRIRTNDGQISGLPRNPRFIRDSRFEKLKQSLAGFVEMLEYRPLIVYPLDKSFVAIAGNMRLRAARELGWKEIQCAVLPADFPIERLRELAAKDNIPFGEDDMDLLANEWTDFPLEDWGMELPQMDEFAPNLEPQMSNRKISAEDIVKTKEELDTHYKDSGINYAEVICPHCLETFFLNPS